MGVPKRCFASIESLRNRHPQVLRDLLALFPAHAAERGLVLPARATVDNLDFASIRDALMKGDIPDELDNILYLCSLLGTVKGWGMVEKELDPNWRKQYGAAFDYDYADLAILAVIQDWPKNKSLLEKANARVRVHAKSAYAYFAPARDLRSKLRIPTEASIGVALDSLGRHFVSEGLVEDGSHRTATEILVYDFEHEVWFLVRHPGRRKRHSGFTRGSWQNFVFNPERYDAVAYNKVYGDLRMNTRRPREHARYRMTFGELLFGEGGCFREAKDIVTLAPLMRADSADLFRCDDIPGLALIAPTALTYEVYGLPPRAMTEAAVRGTTLLDGNRHAPRILPVEAHHALKAVVQYRLKDCPRLSRLILNEGNKVSYERHGDSVVMEIWLRRRGFVQTYVKVQGA